VGDTVDADYERQVLALARSLPPARLTRRSWTADPGSVLGSAGIVVHPAVERETIFLDGRAVEVRSGEGIPNALIEAGLAGKPTIGSRVGGIPEVVEHERTGLLVPPGDQAALAAAIERLVDDPGLREALGANARRFVTARFDPRAALDAVESVYREAARPGGSAGAGAARRGRMRRLWRRRRR
jgi:glycosyltransferase involved in cell wall biosynthesis